MAPASVAAVRFRRWTSERGVSLGTRIRVRRSLSATSAARSMSDRLVPFAMAATVPMLHGQITIPAEGADPEAGTPPRSLSSQTRMLDQSPPVASLSSASDSMPDSAASRRQPCSETMRCRGTCWRARTSNRRTA